jgi:hypothetical protein
MMSRPVLGHGLEALSKRLGPGGSATTSQTTTRRRRCGPHKLGQILGGIGVVVGVAVLDVARGVTWRPPPLATGGDLLASNTARGQSLLLLLLQLGLLEPLPVQLLLDGLVPDGGATAGIFQTELAIGDRDDALVGDDCVVEYSFAKRKVESRGM